MAERAELVVCSSEDAAVLYGHVKAISGDTLTLRNGNSNSPCTVDITYKPGYLARMKVRVGSEIITAVDTMMAFDIMADGGRVKTTHFTTAGRELKYSGELTIGKSTRVTFGIVGAAYVRNCSDGRQRYNYDIVYGGMKNRKKRHVLTLRGTKTQGIIGKKVISCGNGIGFDRVIIIE